MKYLFSDYFIGDKLNSGYFYICEGHDYDAFNILWIFSGEKVFDMTAFKQNKLVFSWNSYPIFMKNSLQ